MSASFRSVATAPSEVNSEGAASTYTRRCRLKCSMTEGFSDIETFATSPIARGPIGVKTSSSASASGLARFFSSRRTTISVSWLPSRSLPATAPFIAMRSCMPSAPAESPLSLARERSMSMANSGLAGLVTTRMSLTIGLPSFVFIERITSATRLASAVRPSKSGPIT